MSTLTAAPEPLVHYPDSDGKPMAENTIQFRWITTIQGNLDILFHDRSDVFVAGDNLWYPVKGEPRICLAPDVYVAFGRPKGDRGSYKQWEEGGIPPAVVFEVLSPSNTPDEMRDKLEFYDLYGVREYYVIDPQPPERTTLEVFEREGDRLRPRDASSAWVSPLMRVRFVVSQTTVGLCYPDGKPFLSFVELGEEKEAAEQRAEAERERADAECMKAAAERERADAEGRRATAERERADAECMKAAVERERADAERERANAERQRADAQREQAARLAARLRELGVDPEAI